MSASSDVPGDDGFMSDAQLQAATEAKRKRREQFVEALKKAGVDPSQVDVTRVLSDEEAAKLARDRAAREEARQTASKSTRRELREKFRQTVERHTEVTPDEPIKLPTPEELRAHEHEDEGTV